MSGTRNNQQWTDKQTKIRQDKSTCISYCRENTLKPKEIHQRWSHFLWYVSQMSLFITLLLNICAYDDLNGDLFSLTICEARDTFCLPSEPIYARVHFIVCCIDWVWTLFLDKEAQWAGCSRLRWQGNLIQEMSETQPVGFKVANMSVSCPWGDSNHYLSVFNEENVRLKVCDKPAITFVKLH